MKHQHSEEYVMFPSNLYDKPDHKYCVKVNCTYRRELTRQDEEQLQRFRRLAD